MKLLKTIKQRVLSAALALGFTLSLSVGLSGCTIPGLGSDVAGDGIVIASGSTSERQIMAEMIYQLLEHDHPEKDVSMINNLGTSTLIHQAMARGDVNVASVMYTGTSLTGELGREPITDPAKALAAVQQGYRDEFGRKWFPSYGFENTYAFMITREMSEQRNIHKVSDLGKYASELRAGVDTSWMERKGDGYADFKRVYGFDFERVYPMEIGLVYNAVRAGEMDVVLGYTTDGRVDTYDLVILEDDLHLFPPYDACPVATLEALKQHPEIEEVLDKLLGKIDTSTMQRLNRQADDELIEPRNVAKAFLEEHDYFAENGPAAAATGATDPNTGTATSTTKGGKKK